MGAERRRKVLDELIGDEDDVARAHAVLLAQAKRSGRPRGAHDLVIAATALARGRTLITIDESGFANLPGVLVRAPT